MKHYGDITKLSGYTLPVVDCITGGSPCQDLSVAGKRAGLNGERSGLFMEQIRLVKEMREHDRSTGRPTEYIRPRYMVWENVPGAFSSNGGKDFQAVLTEIVKIAEQEAPDVPMPDRGGGANRAVSMMKWEDGRLLGDFTTQSTGESPREERGSRLSQILEVLAHQKYSLSAKACIGILRRAEKRGKELPPRLKAALERQAGLSPSRNEQENQGVVPAVQEPITMNPRPQSMVCQEGIAATLGADDYKEPQFVAIENHPNDSRVKISEDGTVQTLSGRMGTGGGNTPMVMKTFAMQGFGDYTESDAGSAVKARDYKDATDLVTYGLDRASFNQGENAKYNFSVDEELVGAQTARGPGAVCDDIVRRLTPMECERLQGYPDGWTDIGEWTDSKGKLHKESSDSARYKALGNSIALPFWFYLLRRIAAQYERPATLGSLFDGIGGFPLCWEMCNGKGTAIWASEIEEFPIAVTKRHFPEVTE